MGAIGVGSYSDGFGVAFTLLDQFTAVARRIEASMSSLTGATTSFAAKTNAALDSTTIGGFKNIREKSAHMKSTAEAKVATAEANRINLATNTAMVGIMGELEQQELAVATREAMMMDGRMRQNRLYNSIQREQLILDRQIEEAAIASAAAQAAALESRNLALTQLGASIAGLALIVHGAKTEAAFQKAELTIEGFVGSAKKAHEIFLQIQADTDKNPFMGFQDRLQAFDLLISQGINSTLSERVTNNLSNLLTAVGRGAPELRRVSRELEKIAANGKLTGRELYQAAAAGIPLRNILEDYFGHKLPDTLKDLPISIDDLDKALDMAMRKGGRYAMALEKVMESTVSQWKSMTQYEIPLFFQAIGKAVDPVTNVVVSALDAIFKFLRVFSASWVGQAFWMLTTALLLLAGTMGLATMSGKALSWVLARLVHGLGHATVASLRATMATEGLAGSFAMLSKSIMANPAFMWFTAIAGAVLIASNAVKHFKAVMSGQEAAADGGWIGTLQKLGGVLLFVAEAFATYDSKTHKSTFDQSFVTALDKLGLHDVTAKLQTWIGAIMSFMDGFSSGLYSFFSTLYDIFQAVTYPIRLVMKLLGYLIPSLNNTNDSMEGWVKTGKMLAWVLGTLLVGQLWKMGAALVAVIAKIIIAEGELMAFTLPLLAELWPAMIIIAGAAALIATNIDFMGDSFDKSTKPIDEAGIALEKYNKHLGNLNKLQDLNTRIQYELKHNPNGTDLQGLLYEKNKIEDKLEKDKKYGVNSPTGFDLQQKQQQQAEIDASRGAMTYPSLSAVNTKQDNRTINATLVVDGKILANILMPYQEEITRRKNATANT